MPKPKQRRYPVMTVEVARMLRTGVSCGELSFREGFGLGVADELPPGCELVPSWNKGSADIVYTHLWDTDAIAEMTAWIAEHRPGSVYNWHLAAAPADFVPLLEAIGNAERQTRRRRR